MSTTAKKISIFTIGAFLLLAVLSLNRSSGKDANTPNLYPLKKSLQSGGDELELSRGELVVKMIVATGIVAVLGIAVVYLSRKVLPGMHQISGQRVRVVETIGLGQRRRIHLLQIDETEILIGSTDTEINRLHVLENKPSLEPQTDEPG